MSLPVQLKAPLSAAQRVLPVTSPHADMGAAIVRVGFEDSLEYNGRTAASSAELVSNLRRELEQQGHKIIGPEEARLRLLG